jgi:hypothetical protein
MELGSLIKMDRKHKKTIYWSAVINHEVPIPAGSRVSVKAHPDRSEDELLLVVNGAVYGCLVRLKSENESKVLHTQICKAAHVRMIRGKKESKEIEERLIKDFGEGKVLKLC